jgi:hypothetical protein
MNMLDKLCDVNGTRVVTLCDAVASKTCLSEMLEQKRSIQNVGVLTYQLIDQRDQRLKVFLDGQMEYVSVFDIDGDCKRSDMVVERDTLTFLLFMI